MSGNNHQHHHHQAIQDHHVTSSFANTSPSSSSREEEGSNVVMSKPESSSAVAHSSSGTSSSSSRKPAAKSIPVKRAFSDGSLIVQPSQAKRTSAGNASSDDESLASIRELKYPDHGCVTAKQLSDYPTYTRNEYSSHECSNQCVLGESQQGLSEYIKVVHSPLILPLLFGWVREVRTHGKTKKTLKKFVKYFTPCGKQMDYIKDVYDYLMKIGSIVPITVFTFEVDVDLSSHFHIKKDSIRKYDEDLAKKILDKPYARYPIFNCFTDSLPDSFSYVKKISKSEKVVRMLKEKGISERTEGCGCHGTCTVNCLCFNMYEDERGYCYGRLLRKQNYIVECNDNCKCGPTCLNRVTTNTVSFPLILYFYPDKGWGVRTLCDIPKGCFLAYYYGQVVADSEISEKHDKYLVALDFKGAISQDNSVAEKDGEQEESELLNLDGRRFGNIARFMNHSCDPNVFVQVIQREMFSGQIYNVAFFTARNIKAGEELAWDYGYEVGSLPNRRIVCMCRAKYCREYML